ncbi:MAG: aminopeptidase P family protein [Ruminococcus sp.]|jgi:Xaa-Pro aminopeptidase
MVKDRLKSLRQVMQQEKVDYYLIPTDDPHGSEYVGESFKCREFITGFTGSAGTALIWQEGAGLWTDARYHIQAQKQLKGSGITLFKEGMEDVPSLYDFLKENLREGQCLAADGAVISESQAEKLQSLAREKQAFFRDCGDLTDRVWKDRPARSAHPVCLLPPEISGVGTEEKIAYIRDKMREKGADLLVLSVLDEICWLFNIRGSDIPMSLLPLAFAVVEEKRASLYLQKSAWNEKMLQWALKHGIETKIYDDIYGDLARISAGRRIWADQERVNRKLFQSLDGAARVISESSPVEPAKAVKNETELQNFRKAHLKDGAAVTRFLFWLKKHVGKEKITEISAAKKLEEFRREWDSYLLPSFDPIVAYQDHGAVVHYSASQDTDRELEAAGFLLMDTGGQYREGTTDITRTVALGLLSEKQKEHYTRVLMGNLRLAALTFPYGCSGENLDLAARLSLWEAGLDYQHGTGHGVGFLMNVHEGPQAVRWRHRTGSAVTVLEEGMVVSNEPGIYIEGEYGIRLENLLICRKKEKNDFGRFMNWEVLTLVPFEREAVLTGLMGNRERDLLNAYHAVVREKLLPMMKTEEERDWLQDATKAL